MAVEFKISERVDLGSVADMVGEGGILKLSPLNLARPDKRLQVTLIKADGTRSTILCSPTVSALVRSKELSLGQLEGFRITEYDSKTGEPINVITMPEGGPGIEYKVTHNFVPFEATALAFDPSELVAF
jgi:hypothetical protein